MIYKIKQKLSDLPIQPHTCLSCGEVFGKKQKVTTFQDDLCTPILKGWFCDDCVPYVEKDFFSKEEIIYVEK